MTDQQFKQITDPYFVFGVQKNTALALSDSNDIIAYADAEHHINLIDSEGSKLFAFLQDFDIVKNLCFAQNDQFIIAATKQGFQIYGLESQKPLFTISNTDTDAHDSAVNAVCVVGNIFITGGQDTAIKQWYFGPVDDDIHDHANSIGLYSIQADSWQLTFQQTLEGHKTPVYRIIRSNNTVVSLGSDTQVKIYKIEHKELKQVTLLNEHSSDVLSAAISPNGKLIVTGSRDNCISISTLEGELISKFKAHDMEIIFVSFTGDGEFILTASYNGVFRLFKSPELQNKKKKIQSNESTFMEVQQQLQTVQSNTSSVTLKTIYVNQLEQLLQYSLHDESLCNVIMGQQQPLLITVQLTNYLRIWDIQDISEPDLIKEIFSHKDEITDIKQADKDVILTSSKDGSFAILDFITGDKCAVINNGGSINSVEYSQSEQQIFASSSNYDIFGYQVLPNALPQKFCIMKGHKGRVTEIIASDSMLITSGDDSFIMLWNIPQYNEGEIFVIKPFEKRRFAPANVTAMKYREKQLVLAFADHSIRLYKVQKLKIIQKLVIEKAHAAQITGVEIVDGMLISCAVDGTIKQFSLRAKANKRYEKDTVLTSTIGSPVECFNRLIKSSSHVCQLQMILPSQFGLPNCISYQNEKLAIGTTIGTVIIVNLQFEIEFEMTTEGHETATKILMQDQKVVVGFRKGMIQIWDLENEFTKDKKVSVLVGLQLEEPETLNLSDLQGEVTSNDDQTPHFMEGRKLDLSDMSDDVQVFA